VLEPMQQVRMVLVEEEELPHQLPKLLHHLQQNQLQMKPLHLQLNLLPQMQLN
jgi:hypothetical protein